MKNCKPIYFAKQQNEQTPSTNSRKPVSTPHTPVQQNPKPNKEGK